MSNLYYYSNPSGLPYRLTNTNLVGTNSSLPAGLVDAQGNPDNKVNYFSTKMVCLNADGSIKPECYVYYRGIKSRSEGVLSSAADVTNLANMLLLPQSSFWECLTIKHGSSVLISEANYPTGGNLSTTTVSSGDDSGNTFYVTHANGVFEGATSVKVEYDTPADDEDSASWNPFKTGNENINGVVVAGNRRFRRMTINGMQTE